MGLTEGDSESNRFLLDDLDARTEISKILSDYSGLSTSPLYEQICEALNAGIPDQSSRPLGPFIERYPWLEDVDSRFGPHKTWFSEIRRHMEYVRQLQNR